MTALKKHLVVDEIKGMTYRELLKEHGLVQITVNLNGGKYGIMFDEKNDEAMVFILETKNGVELPQDTYYRYLLDDIAIVLELSNRRFKKIKAILDRQDANDFSAYPDEVGLDDSDNKYGLYGGEKFYLYELELVQLGHYKILDEEFVEKIEPNIM